MRAPGSRYSRRVRWLTHGLIALAAVAACSRAGDESRTKRAPTAPPPPVVEIPADLKIAVEIDGAPVPAIDAARLTALPADFADTERKAWRLTTLVPAFSAPGRTVEAVGPSGMTLKLDSPESATASAPVLFLTRRGDVLVTVVDPAHPFPDFHGQGGRLRRPGDATPHLGPVSLLRVTRR